MNHNQPMTRVSGLPEEEIQQVLLRIAELSASNRRQALLTENSFKTFLIANDLAWLWDKLVAVAAVAKSVWDFIKDLIDSF
jgi:hypothetical protein